MNRVSLDGLDVLDARWCVCYKHNNKSNNKLYMYAVEHVILLLPFFAITFFWYTEWVAAIWSIGNFKRWHKFTWIVFILAEIVFNVRVHVSVNTRILQLCNGMLLAPVTFQSLISIDSPSDLFSVCAHRHWKHMHKIPLMDLFHFAISLMNYMCVCLPAFLHESLNLSQTRFFHQIGISINFYTYFLSLSLSHHFSWSLRTAFFSLCFAFYNRKTFFALFQFFSLISLQRL